MNNEKKGDIPKELPYTERLMEYAQQNNFCILVNDDALYVFKTDENRVSFQNRPFYQIVQFPYLCLRETYALYFTFKSKIWEVEIVMTSDKKCILYETYLRWDGTSGFNKTEVTEESFGTLFVRALQSFIKLDLL